VACGDGSPAEVMTKPPVTRWFEPASGNADRLRARLEAYRALYPALRSVQAKL
jgi:hypothetical protein